MENNSVMITLHGLLTDNIHVVLILNSRCCWGTICTALTGIYKTGTKCYIMCHVLCNSKYYISPKSKEYDQVIKEVIYLLY